MNQGTTSFRFDDKVKGELDYIKDTLQASQSEAIKEAIHIYYQILMKKSTESPVDILKKSGFIGSFKGNKNLSKNYKQKLERGWKNKHGIK